MIRAGVLNMIWKQSARVLNGAVQTRNLQKILISKIKGIDDADFVFGQQRCNSSTNMYLGVKKWMPHFTFKFWTICVSLFPVWGQKCGEIGSSFFSIIMCVHTLQRSSNSFWPKKSGTVELSSIFARLKAPFPHFALPKLKLKLKGDHYASIEDIQKSVTISTNIIQN